MSDHAYRRLIDALEANGSNGRDHGAKAQYQCPAHEDRNPSLTVTDAADRVLVCCHAGCDSLDVLGALGLEWGDLFDEEIVGKGWRTATMRRLGVRANGDGRVTLGGVAYMPGAPSDEKTRAAKGASRDLWPDPATVDGDTLYVVEGEPDAVSAAQIDLPAVGVPGTNGMKADFAERLGAGRRRVVVIADSDAPGRKAAAEWAAAIAAHCADVRVLDLNPLRDNGFDLGDLVAETDEADRKALRRQIERAGEICETVKPPEREPGWLTGEPMDPIAVAAEPITTTPGFPFAHAGAGILVSGPTGAGRSSLAQAGAYDAAKHGIRVAYLGSEVTEPEFHARAAKLAASRGDTVDDGLRAQLARVRYLSLATTIAAAWRDPERWVRDVTELYDVIEIDPLSAVASALGLDFDSSNKEFIAFYDRLVQPLAARGRVVIMLENVGHAEDAQKRAKGASAKEDRADLTFWCKRQANPVGLIITTKKVRTVRAPFRYGDSWVFLADTQTIEPREHEEQSDTPRGAFRPTHLMERASRAVEEQPGLTRNAVRLAVGGKAEYVDMALRTLVSEGYIEVRKDGSANRHHSLRPFRQHGEEATK